MGHPDPIHAGGLRGAVIRRLVAAVVLVLAATSPVFAMKVLVLGEADETLTIVDADLERITGEVLLNDDPDGDRQPDPSSDVCSSTIPGLTGQYAFVLQEEFVRVIDLVTESIVQTHDIETAIGLSGVTLVGCHAATPRSLTDPTGGGSQVGTYLHLVADVASAGGPSEAYFIVIGQPQLLMPPPLSVAGQGSLGAGTVAQSVRSLGLPAGELHQRAWYQVFVSDAAGDEIRSVQVTSGNVAGAPWTAGETRTFPVTATPTAPLRLGAPLSREQPVLPKGSTGEVENTDLMSGCTLGGELTAVSTTGPGPGSYTHFVTRRDTNELLFVDGGTCAVESVTTGAGPVDVATAGVNSWMEAYTANRDGDNMTIVRATGATVDVAIGTGGAVCTSCPVAVDVPQEQVCTPSDVRLRVLDIDADGLEDDLRISWDPSPCDSASEFVVYCGCASSAADPSCPCYCDCSIPTPGCECPGLVLFASEAAAGAVGLEPDVPIQKNKWKELGRTGDNEFDALDLGDDEADLDINVEAE